MEKFLKRFERVIVVILLVMMACVVLLSTVELAVLIVEQMLLPPLMLLDMGKLLKIFSFFLMVLIGLELIEVIKVYLVDEQVHVEVIFLVAIIAIARKVIVLDVKGLAPLNLIGFATIILALAGGYYLLRRGLNIRKINAGEKKRAENREQNTVAGRQKRDYRRQKPDYRKKRTGGNEQNRGNDKQRSE